MASKQTILEAALYYAQRGWRVVPLSERDRDKKIVPRPGKVPIIAEWPVNASTDFDTIHDWFREYPFANVGIATGEKSGIFVLDVDGEQGEASLIDLETTFGKLPQTYEVETSRGRHLYFAQPLGVRTKSSASETEIGLKLDVRGDGGQVVAPPSIHPETKKQYKVKRDVAPAPAPKWLLDLVNAARQNRRLTDNLIPDKVKKGSRNAEMTRIAGKLRRQGSTAAEMLAFMKQANTDRFFPPLKDSDLVTIANSIAKKDPARVLIDGRLNEAEFVISLASEGKDEPTTWRWPLFLPRGMLIGWGGDPGLGKSTMAYTVAAAISKGDALPGDDGLEKYEPSNVIILSAEDDINKTIRPRLRVAGADMKHIKIIAALTNVSQPVSFPQHLTQLAEIVRESSASLVIIDPLDAFLGEDIDSHKNAEVRRAIMPLAQIAESTNATVLILGHLNKSSNSSVMYRFGGSIAFTAAPRACFAFAPSEDGTEGHRIFACVKTNVGKMPKSWKYEIVDQHVEGIGGVAKIHWLDQSEETAESVLSSNGNSKHTSLQDAKDFLRETLKDGPRLSTEIDKECIENGICKGRTLKAARKEVAKSWKVGLVWYTALKGFDFSTWKEGLREPGEDDETNGF